MAKKASKLSETTDAINQSGSFLQTHVMHQLDKEFAWSVDSEFPVQAIPFVDDPDALIKRQLSASGQQYPEPDSAIFLYRFNQS